MKKHNFNAGPSILPAEVIKQTAEAIIDFQGEGLSILEISHRAKYFQPVLDEAEALMEMIKKEFDPAKTCINHVGPVIGSHSGPGTMALFFLAKER